MIKYIKNKEVLERELTEEELVEAESKNNFNAIPTPTEIERIEALEMAMLELAEVLANG